MNNFTVWAQVHRSGRPSGQVFVVDGDPFDDASHDHHADVVSGNWSFVGGFQHFELAQDAADNAVMWDDDGWAQWAY